MEVRGPEPPDVVDRVGADRLESIEVDYSHIRLDRRSQLHVLPDVAAAKIQFIAESGKKTSENAILRTSPPTVQVQMKDSKGDMGKDMEVRPCSGLGVMG